ncbi:hypothetical protein SODALDRAFT_348419 [Sodiomyces alkalinus F11]|uniref:Uncharacterized protein n=1 Tax=Sodiomyces alkalinus (strain CBS 110278 / VKM F-3762 / F11) TaxID=1314773 RepID=A0A3N2QAX4_SODAK|nr:hypothetical protein SODALDRAFT_348419 [Sodiomyces alkalinus F11]ROT43785.1 hypothetical protein SODALDRAFT_348419 [Sodiomyces alkalinus F11]
MPGPRTSTMSAGTRASFMDGRPSWSSFDALFKHRERPDVVTPTTKLTAHQAFYLFVVHGLCAMAISAIINFAIAYAMYTTQDLSRNPIRLFQLPNTLAGDAAVTIIIQCIITWLIERVFVRHDLHNGGVKPIGFVAEPKGRFPRWFMLLNEDNNNNTHHDTGPRRNKVRTALANAARFVATQAPRAAAFILASFVLFWPVSVGVLTTIGRKSGGDWVFDDRWAPQIFKAVLGGALALLTTPLMAAFWMVRDGWLLSRAQTTHAAWVV